MKIYMLKVSCVALNGGEVFNVYKETEKERTKLVSTGDFRLAKSVMEEAKRKFNCVDREDEGTQHTY